MSFRLLLVCSLMLTLSACGATSPSMADGQSADPDPTQVGQLETPKGDDAASRTSTGDAASGEATEFVSFTPQEGGAAPNAENAAENEDIGTDGETGADGATGADENPADVSTDIVLLARAISELRTSIDSLREQNRKIMDAVGVDNIEAELQLADPSQPSSSADSLVDIVMDLRDTVAFLAAENQAFGKLIQEQTTVLKPIPPVPTQGTLIVENNTDGDQYVWINGAGRWVWARTTFKVSVPVGEITTKLSGESQKTWEIKAPNYQEHIEFVQP